MPINWEIDIEWVKNHANNVLLREYEGGTIVNGKVEGGKFVESYKIPRLPEDTIQTLREKAKVLINERRAKRAKADAIKSQFNSAQFEAFLNS